MPPAHFDIGYLAVNVRPCERRKRAALLTAALLLTAGFAAGQTADPDAGPVATAIEGLKLRGIGPALMGGRIADIAVHPQRRSTWYVVVGSGGLWKTENGGTTWKPIFDEYPSYSIGTVALDPSNPEVVWLGTGENVSGRHVGWGDGVYRSRNGGASWEQAGLAGSQHLGKILVDPRDGDTVLVAAEGPLWNGGGERGVYRTEDGGATWTRTLDLGPDTGVTDLEFAPGDPDTVYAAAYQRRRHVWSFLAGGPGSGIHKSDDGGRTFRKITKGLPKGDVGKVGLAVTPADPRLVYATIEADEEERGFYRSGDRGESWERRNPYISGGTGPHYYQEIEASPDRPGPRVPDGRLLPRDPGRRQDLRLPRHRTRKAQRQPRDLDRSERPRPPARRHRLGALRNVRRGSDLAAFPEHARLPVLQGGAQQRRTLLRPPRGGAGPRVGARSFAHPEPGRGPQPRLVRAARGGRLRRGDRSARPEHPLPDDPAGEPLPRRPAERGDAAHPAVGRPRRTAGTLELGLPGPDQPAQRGPAVLRVAASVAE